MEVVNLVQGSQEWLDFRKLHYPASEAPSAMSCSKFEPKTVENLALVRLGVKEYEVTDYQQMIFDRGHEAEDNARILLEALIEDDLSPITGKKSVKGLNMPLSASFDGITFDGDIIFEHKYWNEELAEDVKNNKLKDAYYWQLEQQLLVSGAKKVIFVTSDSFRVDSEGEARELEAEGKMVSAPQIDRETGATYYVSANYFEKMEYKPVRGRKTKLIDGWKHYQEVVSKVLVEGGEWDDLTSSMLPIMLKQEKLKKELKELDEELSLFTDTMKDYAMQAGTKKLAVNGIELTQSVRKGGLDEKKIMADLSVESLDAYRKDETVSWRIKKVSDKKLTDEDRAAIKALQLKQAPKNSVYMPDFVVPEVVHSRPGQFAF